MYVMDHMVRAPVTINPEVTIQAAQEILGSRKFRHLPVTDGKGKLIGMVTDRDLRSAQPSSVLSEEQRRALAGQLAATPVSKIMSRKFFSLSCLATLDDALLIFDREKIGALPVVDSQQRVVGIFSIRDLIQAYKKLFGLGEKWSCVIAVKPDGKPGPMSRLAQVLEENAIRFSHLAQTLTPEQHGAQEIIYLRVHTYNINAVHAAIRGVGFAVHEPVIPDICEAG